MAGAAGSAPGDLDAQVRAFLDRARGDWHDMNVPYEDGQALHDLIVKKGFTRGLEIGTSTGHSGIWIAWAMSKTGGKLVTIEIDERRHRTASKFFKAVRSCRDPSTSSSPTRTRTGTRSTSRTWRPSSRSAAASPPTTSSTASPESTPFSNTSGPERTTPPPSSGPAAPGSPSVAGRSSRRPSVEEGMTVAGTALATTLTCAPFERADRRGGTRVVMRCESERALVDFDPEGLDARERDAFVRLADRGIADLERLLAPSGAVPPRTERVRYVVSRRVDMSRAFGRTVLLPLERVKSQSAPYLHETVHALVRTPHRSTWLSEGLACYLESWVAENVGGYDAHVFTRAGDHGIHEAARRYLRT